MGRPRIEWTDVQLRQIRAALPRLNRSTQQDNARFLDGVIAVVRAATGRLYGATTYSKLLRNVAPQAGIERSPSSSTVQAAVLRAQSFAGAQPGTGSGEVAQAKRTRPIGGSGDDALQLRLNEAALLDARTRIRRLEQEAANLRRQLGRAEAARDLAGKHVNALLEGLHDTITGSGSSAAVQTQAAKRLDRIGRFLKTQNEAMCRQATHEAATLREQNGKLSERIDRLLLDNARYRQMLAAQPARRRARA
jgi:hypothetical protein